MLYPNKLIITATLAKSYISLDVNNWPHNPNEMVEDVVKCYEAGASVVHLHLPSGEESEIVKRIRERCDIIIQAGFSARSIHDRESSFKARPEMMSVALNHHALSFPSKTLNVLHPLEELEEYCKKLKDLSIKPAWEVWGTGSFWNLNYLCDKSLLDWANPHILTLFFNWPGGTWSPPNYDEYMHRKNYMREDCIHSVSVMGDEQMKLLVFVLTHGGNIRVGTEDYPFLKKGKPAIDNAELVKNYVSISKHVGREVADPSEARKILGL